MPQFQVVEDDEKEIAAKLAQANELNAAARKAMLMALGQLSQRAVAGWSALFSLLSLASAWLLWYSCLPEPTTLQIVSIGIYSLFLLALEVIRRKL